MRNPRSNTGGSSDAERYPAPEPAPRGAGKHRDDLTVLNRFFAPVSPAQAFPRRHDEWRALARAGDRRGLCGLVLERVRQFSLTIPPDVLVHLHTGTARVVGEQLHMTHHASRLLRAFNDAGVPVMLLKGMALTHGLYEQPGLRPMSDVDLLVRGDDLEKSTTVLRESGCRRGAALVRDDFFPRFYYESEWLTGTAKPVRLDFHVRPFRPLRTAITVPEDALWEDARQIDVGGARAWVPSWERMFVHLAAHAAYHGCSRLIWLYDLARLFARFGRTMDWSLVARCCRHWSLSGPVRAAIDSCHDRVGAICPESLSAKLAGHRVSWRDRLVLRQTPRDGDRPLRHVLVNAITTPDVRLAVGYTLACLQPNDNHLGAFYAGRHRGWRVCAHLIRGARATGRALCGVRRRPVLATLGS